MHPWDEMKNINGRGDYTHNSLHLNDFWISVPKRISSIHSCLKHKLLFSKQLNSSRSYRSRFEAIAGRKHYFQVKSSLELVRIRWKASSKIAGKGLGWLTTQNHPSSAVSKSTPGRKIDWWESLDLQRVRFGFNCWCFFLLQPHKSDNFVDVCFEKISARYLRSWWTVSSRTVPSTDMVTLWPGQRPTKARQ